LVYLKKLTRFLIVLLPVFTALSVINPGYAQSNQSLNQKDSLNSDTITSKKDSVKTTGDIKTSIKYSAKDSLDFDMEHQLLNLYGDATVIYGNITLKAALISVNYITNEVNARGILDSLGKKRGNPVFNDAGQEYVANTIRYNFKTRKGIIDGLVTQQGEGYMHGEKVKKNDQDELFLHDAKYTTCNLATPHFHIGANKLKVIPNKKVIAGPFNLYINDVPTPLGFLFGMFPIPKEKSSGIIMPIYGETRDRGFYLRNGGYYWAVNDYLGLTVLGEIFSLGGYGFNVSNQYKKKYKFDGSAAFRYNKQKYDFEGRTDIIENFWINWSHSPVSKGLSRFSANISAGSNKFNARTSFNPQDAMTSTFQSSIAFNTSFRKIPASLSVNTRATQNISEKTIDLSLPEVNFYLNQINPFKSRSGESRTWYQKIAFSYSADATNRISTRPLTNSFPFKPSNRGAEDDSVAKFGLSNIDQLISRTQNGIRHSIPVSTSFNLLKYFNVSPSFNYNELWYPRSLQFTYDSVKNAVRVDTINRFARAYTYGTSLSLSTRVFGTFRFRGNGRVQAIRHQLSPRISFSYAPDFGEAKYGNFIDIQTDTTNTGEPVISRVSRFQGPGFAYGAPGSGQTGAIGFGLTNNLEMKIREKGDSAVKYNKLAILDNFGINGSYNLLADSFKLSNIGLNTVIRFTEKYSVNLNATLDPYQYLADSAGINKSGIRKDRLSVFSKDGIGRITNGNLAFSLDLTPGKKEKKQYKSDAGTPEELEFINKNPDLYIDFDVPWTFATSYVLSYNRDGLSKANLNHSLSFTGSVKLTNKWNIQVNSGYDLVAQKITDNTLINISRDLHCWQMNITWQPLGVSTSY
jgi:hypothetical protein